jgi:transcriptional regulator with XRE-family HTH domain
MLLDRNHLTEILELNASSTAEFCDGYFDATTLSEHIEREDPFSRKELCKYLGIGESTLTGWLKEDRIPLMAKQAMILPLAHRVLKGEVTRLKKDSENAQILKSGDHYQIVVFKPDESGEAIGKVIADNIVDLRTARIFVAGVQALNLLGKCDNLALEYTIDHFSDGEYPDHLENLESLQHDIRMCRAYAVNFDHWRDWKKTLAEIEYYKTKEGRRQENEKFDARLKDLFSESDSDVKSKGEEK